MGNVIVFFVFAFIVIALTIFYYYQERHKEKTRYRLLVPEFRALQGKGVNFSLIEIPSDGEYYVHVFDEKFKGESVFDAARSDILKLQSIGYTVKTEYFYFKSAPPSQEEHERLLSQYDKNLKMWSDEKQGRPDPRTKPNAPYDRVVTTLVKRFG